MKNIFTKYLMLPILIFSCSNESIDIEIEPNNPQLKNYIFRTYNVTTSPNTIILERSFNLDDDRIINSTNTSSLTTDETTAEYEYSNNRISRISQYINGTIVSIKNFSYNVNGNLIEYQKENIDNSQSSFYTKIVFTHTADTIFGVSKGSQDGINFDTDLATTKIVLDANKNKTYQEIYTFNNNQTSYTNYTYDSNNNMIISNEFKDLNGTFFPTLSFTYAYESTINTLGKIYEETFGRATLMLLNQHRELNTSAINYYNAKYIATNCFESVTTNFFGNSLSAEFESDSNSENYSTYSNYSTLDSGSLIARFSYDYIFE
ncbi:MAG: hypothetical protein ED556_11560 [Winogradskyella sp.]|uniref:hypothetical protein n=1 Tax=Winogradskyella sp. TaxID=1883156 RepID=UPI000F3B7409|nr:hypothetical protein [Winogradskyella sp.]RNC84092.1 MAG: hypothetical protein ED556_11560 [Winogradskyella sp.]